MECNMVISMGYQEIDATVNNHTWEFGMTILIDIKQLPETFLSLDFKTHDRLVNRPLATTPNLRNQGKTKVPIHPIGPTSKSCLVHFSSSTTVKSASK